MPPMEELFTLARNKCKSLTNTNKWNAPKKPASYNASNGAPFGNQKLFWLRDGHECFNCGKKCGFPRALHLETKLALKPIARLIAQRKQPSALELHALDPLDLNM